MSARRYLQIEGDVVVNVILWDGEAEYPSEGLIEVPDDSPIGIGWRRVDGE